MRQEARLNREFHLLFQARLLHPLRHENPLFRSKSEAVSDNLIVDFDELGKPVGVTLEHYSQISDSSTIETLLPISPVLQPA